MEKIKRTDHSPSLSKFGIFCIASLMSASNGCGQTSQGAPKIGKKLENQVNSRLSRVVKSDANASSRSVVKSIKIAKEGAANKILTRFNASNNLAVTATAFSTSSWDNPPRMLLRNHRPNSLKGIPKSEFWALSKKPGSLKVKWKEPIKASTILLINRPGNAKGGWGKASLKINFKEIVEINNFLPGSVCLVELKEPVEIKELRLELIKGRNYPGLYSVEVYK